MKSVWYKKGMLKKFNAKKIIVTLKLIFFEVHLPKLVLLATMTPDKNCPTFVNLTFNRFIDTVLLIPYH